MVEEVRFLGREEGGVSGGGGCWRRFWINVGSGPAGGPIPSRQPPRSPGQRGGFVLIGRYQLLGVRTGD